VELASARGDLCVQLLSRAHTVPVQQEGGIREILCGAWVHFIARLTLPKRVRVSSSEQVLEQRSCRHSGTIFGCVCISDSVRSRVFPLGRLGENKKRKALKVTLALCAFSLVELLSTNILQSMILPAFFQDTTSEIVRFTIRLAAPLLMFQFYIEASWIAASICFRNLHKSEMDPSAISVFCFGGIAFPLLGRLMQSSPSSVHHSFVYEAAGTIAEILMDVALLKGNTPLRDNVHNNSQFSQEEAHKSQCGEKKEGREWR